MTSVAVLVFCSIFVGPLSALPQGTPAAAAGTSDTIGAIDTDGNGRVSLVEIEEFARKQGITSEDIRSDFKELDSNADGELDTKELSGLMSPSSGTPTTATADPAATAHAELAATAKVGLAAAAQVEFATTAKAEPAIIEKAEAARPTRAHQARSAVAETVPGLDALEEDARRQAGGIIAGGLAKRAQVMIQQGEKDEKEAVSYEAKALGLRGSASGAAKTMGAETRSASVTAVSSAAKQGLVEAQRLKLTSEELERDAREHHERAKQALRQATQAQDGMSTVTQH